MKCSGVTPRPPARLQTVLRGRKKPRASTAPPALGQSPLVRPRAADPRPVLGREERSLSWQGTPGPGTPLHYINMPNSPVWERASPTVRQELDARFHGR